MVVSMLCAAVWATTWGPNKVRCPLCHEQNEFRSINSYGSYIYGWPSKFQQVFWPRTDSAVLYTCKKCNLSLFMWDFEKFPQDKADAVRKVLPTTRVSEGHEQYSQIPMSVRLDIAEKVYSVLGENDDFWAHFYRVKGYHLACEKKYAEADAARAKARDLVRKLMDDPANADRRKDLLIASAAMSHFLRDDATAKSELESAKKAIYRDPKRTDDENKRINENIDNFIQEYLTAIAENKVPKDDGTDKD